MKSPYRDKFVLKGATLFTLWTGHSHRPTKDLDLLGQGSSAIGEVEQTIRAICQIQEEDGLVFDSASVEGTKIKEEDEYDGVRIKLVADLAGARIPMQIDIGFGDAVYPQPELASFPVLLPMEAPLAPLAGLKPPAQTEPPEHLVTLEDTERDLICRTLRQTNGIIDGSRGAAAILGVKRTTLYSRMQRLGISRKGEANVQLSNRPLISESTRG